MRRRKPKIYGVILAGGPSSLMGEDKALLRLGDETLLDRNTRLLESLGVKEVLVCRNEEGCLHDIYENAGPMAGIHSALMKTKSAKVANTLLVMPIDMPFLDKRIMEDLLSFGNAMRCAVTYSNYQLPLYLPNSAENREFAKVVALSKEDRSIKRYLNIINSTQVNSTELDKLLSMNDKKDWQRALLSLNT
ncbi:molybdenum cofactor guanylyltransferase [Thalassotalea piscium]|uniref:Molybdopterin-guanine dinucleotide biosynthesis protein A n=1 Tax=Thalassotalea piscium TaxID=1230533 RepID=A0A7X0NDX1_9GAMM|nr:molybdenum cofactor guanylyltransferase [Thalassotalea piscium]MBB6541536.1 molybdopterin-guanine dinucleotide biosynthesis protein A [Thalassotalea piscium]